MTVAKMPRGPAITRRGLLELGLLGTAGMMFGDLAGADPAPAGGGTARAVIQVWLWGGPSHLDTFDPKPAAGRDYCGPYGKPIATNVPGIQICQMLPLLAGMADSYALLRGLTHGSNAHETAAYMVQTGRRSGGSLVYPGIGSVVSYFKGHDGGYKGLLPPYVTVTTPQGRFSESGFLGSRYKPFSTGGDPSKEPFEVEGIVAANVSEERQKDRRTLLAELDRGGVLDHDDPLVKSLDSCRQQAYSMILGDAGKAFALGEEKPALRDRYGRHTFGQSCLLARRLVQRGVPFVTINSPGWDTHKQNFPIMGRKLPELDSGLSALLLDLADVGLLESTIVWVSGEFGRTPKIMWEPPWNGGRGHWGKAFSALVAGGGFRGGTVVGKTDERGENVMERPIYPWDLIGSMCKLLGIAGDARIRVPQGGTVPASPLPSGEIPAAETGGLLTEIM